MAGVSRRNRRPRASQPGRCPIAASRWVQKVLDEIDYHPNMFAMGLAAKSATI